MPSTDKPYINKKNGSQYWFLNRLIDRFYCSRFNRDNLHGLAKDEDIDNSRSHRLYNKADISDLLHLFFEFLEWVIFEENLGKIYFTKNMELERTSVLPRIKRANIVDQIKKKDRVTAGDLYVTYGKYIYTLGFTGEAWEKLKVLRDEDPEFIAKREELQKDVDERNKNESNTSKD